MQTKLVLKQRSAMKLRFQPGATGPSGTVTVGTVTTGAPGTDVIVTNSGTPNAAVLNFTIPEGEQGIQGLTGNKGWSPAFAIVTDGARRVLQVDDWVGGEGTKPATGDYVGATGLTPTIGDAIDIRGPAGTATILDGNKGDITTSNSGDTWLLNDGAVGDDKVAAGSTLHDVMVSFPLLNATRAVLLSASIPSVLLSISTSGYNNIADGGGARYARVASAPSHDGWFQSGDGSYWEIAERARVTPEMFGAKRDGSSNDSPAWNKAIAYASLKGGAEVVGLAGEYLIGTRIELKSGVKIRSVIKYKAVLTAAPTVAGGHIMYGEGLSQIEVHDFHIVGNYAGSGQSAHGIFFFNCSYVSVVGNKIENIEGSSIIVNGAFGLPMVNSVIRDNYIVGCYWGITCFKNCIDVQITGNVIEGARNHGILIDEATSSDSPSNPDPLFKPAPNFRIQITGNSIKSCATSNVGAGIAASGTKGITIANNEIVGIGVSGAGGAAGIVCNSGQAFYNETTDIVISGNQINTIYMGPGIQVAGASRFTITGNDIHSVGQGGAAVSTSVIQVIDDNAAGKHTSVGQISGNTLIGSAAATIGVYFGNGATLNKVGSNNFQNLTTDVVNDDTSGTNTIDFIGRGALPTHIAGWLGRIWVDFSGKAWVSNNAAWVGIGTQT